MHGWACRNSESIRSLRSANLTKPHLQRYCTEFDFRYNTRKLNDFERAETALLGAVGKRLTYRRTVVAA